MAKIKKIMFVCTGNTCRSSMAEGIFKKMLEEYNINDIEIQSAGMAVFSPSKANEHAVTVSDENSIDLKGHVAKQIDMEMVKDVQLILTMTTAHKQALINTCPEYSDKIFTLKEFADDIIINGTEDPEELNVSDPFGLAVEDYQQCFNEIYSLLEKTIKKL